MPPVTIGRLVHYYNNTASGGVQAIAAVVTAVASPDGGDRGIVSLTVFPPGLPPAPIEGIPFCIEPTADCWGWPPRL